MENVQFKTLGNWQLGVGFGLVEPTARRDIGNLLPVIRGASFLKHSLG